MLDNSVSKARSTRQEMSVKKPLNRIEGGNATVIEPSFEAQITDGLKNK